MALTMMSVPAGIAKGRSQPTNEVLIGVLSPRSFDQFLAAGAPAVDDGQHRGVGERQLDADGAGGAPCPEHDDPLAARIDHFRERFQEALAVGILADELAVAADGAVHRLHDRARTRPARRDAR